MPEHDIDKLVAAYLEGELSPGQAEQFSAWLTADPANAQYIAKLGLVERGLNHHFLSQGSGDLLADLAQLEADAGAVQPVDRTAEIARRKMEAKEMSRRERRAEEQRRGAGITDQHNPLVIPKAAVWLALAAVIGLVATLMVVFSPASTPTPPVADDHGATDTPQTADAPMLATVVRTFDARWEGAASPALVGDDLAQGEYRLTAGRVEIELANGVRVAAEAPVSFGLAGRDAMSLERGRLVASVPPSAQGFTIQTPTARVENRTATYGIATQSGGTQVNVFRGEVDLYPAAGTGTDAVAMGRVGALEAGVVDAGGRFEPAAFEPTTYDTFADNGLAPRVTRQTATFRQGAGGYRGTVDTWFSGRAGLNEQYGFPRGNYLRVGAWGDVNQQAVLRFDGLFGGAGAQVPGAARIVSAGLVLHNARDIRDSFGSNSPEGDAFAVHRLRVPWVVADSFGDVPWADGLTPQIDLDDREADAQPLADCRDMLTARTSYIVRAGSRIELDVTPAVAAWAAGEPNHGFLMQSLGGHPQSFSGPEEGNSIFLASSEYQTDPALRPTLVITYLTSDSP